MLTTVLVIAVSGVSGQPDDAPQWTWTGFEVMGYRTVTREQILATKPFEPGTPYEIDAEALGAWCRGLKERFDLHQIECAPLRFSDGKAYLVVDVVEKGDEGRASFRQPPADDVELATPEIRGLFEQLESRQWTLFGQGQPPQESAGEGFLDYDDPEMHGLVEKLRQLVPPYRDNLLQVIARDKDNEDRGDAARMLNWAGQVTDSITRVHRDLDDPSGLVRNNLARFMLHYVDQVESAEVRRSVVDALARMLDRPSHGDRNKAVYGLLNIARAHPEDHANVLESAGEALARLAERSILPNVRDPARDLLALLEGETDEKGEEMSPGVDDPVLVKLIPQARADLAERLSISEDDVEVVRAERVTWRDSSLGCPEEGMFYMQMLTDGALIELAAGGKTYPYHSNLEGPPSYCEKPSPAGPLPAGDDGTA